MTAPSLWGEEGSTLGDRSSWCWGPSLGVGSRDMGVLRAGAGDSTVLWAQVRSEIPAPGGPEQLWQRTGVRTGDVSLCCDSLQSTILCTPHLHSLQDTLLFHSSRTTPLLPDSCSSRDRPAWPSLALPSTPCPALHSC